jgi:hypothetical protein
MSRAEKPLYEVFSPVPPVATPGLAQGACLYVLFAVRRGALQKKGSNREREV